MEGTNPDASYVNGDPTIGRQGSIPPAAAFEHPMRELVGVIQKSKFTPTDVDLLQLSKSVRSQRLNWAEDTGSANALSCAFDPPLTAYTLGLPIKVRVSNSNTGGSTINAGAGTVPIRRPDGLPTVPGDLPAGGVADLVFDGTAFQLLNFAGAGTEITVSTSPIPYAVDTGPVNQIQATFSTTPPITSLAAGNLLLVKVANTNTAATTFKVNALAPVAVKARGPTGGVADLLPGDVVAGDVLLCIFDGTNFQITPNVLMPSNATVNVPSQFPTVQAVMNAFARKRIASSARLTISMAQGVFEPFAFFHPDASRITVSGTMIGTPPNYFDFVRTGSSQTARINDTNTNLIMLRQRYGTEIRVRRGDHLDMFVPGMACGVTNIGGGVPLVSNLLITGDIPPGTAGYGSLPGIDEVGVFTGQTGAMFAANVACALLGTGFGGHGNATLVCTNTIALGCSFCGYFSWKTGTVEMAPGMAFSNGYCGAFASTNSAMQVQGHYACNKEVGVLIQTSEGGGTSLNSNTNGTMDIMATLGAKLSLEGAGTIGYGTISPVPNTVGNNNSVIITNF